MKTSILSIFLFFLSLSNFGNITSSKETPRYQFPNSSHFRIPLNYDESSLPKNTIATQLENKIILGIELVYTEFKRAKSFNQEQLNLRRINQLKKDFPALQEVESWQLISQTQAKAYAEAKDYFHGFIIHYQTKPTVESMKAETRAMDKYLAGETTDLACKAPTEMHISIKEGFLGEEMFEVSLIDSAIHGKSGLTIGSYNSNYQRDSTLLKIFNRNQHWKNMVVATDVTGSMSPYNAQLLMWFKLNENNDKINNIYFFNDGDHKTSAQKKVGSVGGIYSSDSKDYENIKNTMYSTMMKGGGGDCPENNLEAAILAQNENPEVDCITLISDNWATPRDMKLISQINKPLRIILCGTGYGVNLNYLNLAIKSGGSIHTMEEDLTKLAELKEGEIISLEGVQFKISNGEFIKVKGS